MAVPVLFLLIGGGTVLARLGGTTNPSSSSSIDLQKGLVGQWKMDGNAKDSTPYGHNGTVIGSPTYVSDRKGTSGAALGISTGTQYVDNVGVDLGNDWTFSAWSPYPNNGLEETSHWRTLMRGNGGDHQVIVESGSYRLGTYDNVGVTGFHACSPTFNVDSLSNAWHHFAITQTGGTTGTMTFYIDGQSTCTVSSYGSTTDVRSLGNVFGGGQEWGTIDDARIYSRALSATEAKALFDTYDSAVKVATGENGLIGRWKFAGNYKDSTPLANNLTVNGTTFAADRKGRANSALSSNGTSDYVYGNIGNGTYFGGNNPLTVSAWVYVTATSSGPIFGVTTAPPGGGWNMPFLSLNGTTVYGWIYNNTPISTTAAANQWHHIAMAYNPSGSPTTILYMDGQPAGTATGAYAGSGSVDYFTTYLTGVKPNAGVANFLNTPISDVRAYSRVLSAADVATQYNSYNSQLSIGGSGAPGSVSLGKGLVGDWAMNGNAKDNTPYGNNGTVNGAALTTDRKGRANSAYSFNGSSSYINAGSSSLFAFSGSFTLSAWVNPSTTTGWQGVASRWGNTWAWALDSSSHRNAIWINGWDYGNTSIPANTWSLITVVYNSSAHTVSFFYNGNPDGTVTDNNVPGNSGNVTIGNWGGTYWYIGLIDDVHIYNRAIGASEVQALYASYR